MNGYELSDGSVWERVEIDTIIERLYRILSDNKLSIEKSKIVLNELEDVLQHRAILRSET